MKKVGKIKVKIATFLIVAMCINSFAAVVSDNDGSAFVTKAEFDALKASFNKQISDYNSSIDGKVDGAIASYLSGIALVKTTDRDPLVGNSGQKLTFFTPNDDLAYDFAPPQISGNATRIVTRGYTVGDQWRDTKAIPTLMGWALIECHLNPNNSLATRFQKKTAISDLDTTLRIAKWDGYYEKCQDKVVLDTFVEDAQLAVIAVDGWGKHIYGGLHVFQLPNVVDSPLEGQTLLGISGYSTPSQANSAQTNFKGFSIDASFAGRSNNIYAALFNYNYDMFSNTKRNYNWGYPGTYQTTFDGYPSKGNYPKGDDTDVLTDIMTYATGGKGTYLIAKLTDEAMNVSGYYIATPSGTYVKDAYSINETHIEGGNFWTHGSGACNNVYVPMIGFETKYLKNWGQIYNTNYDQYITAGATSIVTDASSNKHMRMTNGVPFVELKKGESFTYTFNFEDKTKNYWIWMKDSPFLSENNTLPATNETTLDLEGCGTKTNGAYKINNGVGEVRYTNNTGNTQMIYLKFASGGTAAPSSYDTIDGGTLLLEKVYVHVPD